MKLTATSPIFSTHCDSPLGRLLLAATPAGLAGIWFEGQKHSPLDPQTQGWRDAPEHPVLRQAVTQLQAYFQGQAGDFELPLDLSHGTEFQQAVWQALRAIPRGSTSSYGRLSAAIGRPAAVRAVGAAVGRNPISVIVPCHRVLGAAGALTGYAGGLHRKSALLKLEGAAP